MYFRLIVIYFKAFLKMMNIFYKHFTQLRASQRDIMWHNGQRNAIVSKNKVCVFFHLSSDFSKY